MPQLIWIGDASGNLYYFNQSVYQYTRLAAEQVDKDNWLEQLHPDDREESVRRWTRAIQTGEDFLMENRFRRHDGVYRWHLSRAIPQRDCEGNIGMWVGTSTDIHDQKTFAQQLEQKVQERTQELNNEKQFAETILDSSVDNICVFDEELRYLVVNKKCEEAYGRKKRSNTGAKDGRCFS